MGQKVHPVGFRIGVYRPWDARWFARPNQYGKSLLEDIKLRAYLEKHLKSADIARIEIEKAGNSIRIVLHSGRPGAVIGKKGQGIEGLRKDIATFLGKSKVVELSVQELKKPELNARLVAKSIADQLSARGSYKKAMKTAALASMRAGAKGIKICCSGRLNGAEIARSEWTRVGSVPLHTLKADIDYALAEALTTYGKIGVKVWICRGEYRTFNLPS
ncbi:30S ribosomal protein S3 [bacterium]|nr:MAG: 30S ribosomal protein S3 [bacterium]QQR62039.1 MAG: 30S ribosomal protein S3 [bacterium]QQR62366.1 MAG: 30S ribosomal protein S3 [bacterium]